MHRSPLYLLCAVLFFLSSIGVVSKTTPAPKQITIGRLPTEYNEPIRIRAVKVKGHKVRSRKKFVANGDWLRNLAITLKNRTGKRILFASVDVLFTDPRGSGGPAIDHIDFGNRSLMHRSPTAEETLSGLDPEQEVDLALSGITYERMRSFLTEIGYWDSDKIWLKLGMVIFADDSSWYGDDFKRDPQSPSNWIRTGTRLEEPSRARSIWPESSMRHQQFTPQLEKVTKSQWLVPTVSSIDSRSLPQLESLFVPATYRTTAQSSQCYKKDYPGKTLCSFAMSCDAVRDRTDMTPGGFQFITGHGPCTNSLGNHCGTVNTTIAIACVFDGGGGGGMGGEDPCSDDWECAFGYSCTPEGYCQDDWLLNQ